MLASCPASILNHFSTLLGIPFRFGFISSRSREPQPINAPAWCHHGGGTRVAARCAASIVP